MPAAVVIVPLLLLLAPSVSLAQVAAAGIPTSWANLPQWHAKQFDGVPARDYESSQDPTNGGTGINEVVDIASQWNGVDDATAPHENCNPDLSLDPSPPANGRCGLETSAFWGYYDGGTPYDPNGTDTDGDGLTDSGEDDFLFLRMRMATDPTKSTGFEQYHYNYLMDTTGNGYKEFWFDLDGTFTANGADRLQVLYEPTDIPEISCGGGSPTQQVADDDDARVYSFTACHWDFEAPGRPAACANSFTRAIEIDPNDPNTLRDQWWIDIQVPVDAMKTLACTNCPGAGGGTCTPSTQAVTPFAGGALSVGFFFSTSTSNQDPLQKDFIARCAPDDGPCDFPPNTPVTVSSFEARRAGRQVAIEWSTATEAGTAGFNLLELTPLGWLPVNARLIPARAGDTTEPQSYAFEATTAADRFLLEEVDILGRSQRHGPFEVGTRHGRAVTPRATDWQAIRSAHQALVEQRHALVPKADRAVGPAVDLLVDRDGIHRVTFEQLLAAGFDLSGVAAKDLAVLNRGVAVPIRLGGGDTFGPGSFVEFLGEAVGSLYTDTNRYALVVDRTWARRLQVDPSPGLTVRPRVRAYPETLRVDEDRLYSYSSPTGDPWYHTRMLAYTTPESWSFDFDVDEMVDKISGATLSVDLWGVTNWPATPDHHVVVSLNGAHLGEAIFDGREARTITAELPLGLLKANGNTLTLELPGDTGVDWDVVALEGFRVTYPRAFVARDGALRFTAAGPRLQVKGLDSPEVVVYRLDKSPVLIQEVSVKGENGSFTASFPGGRQPSDYLVSTIAALPTPSLTAPRPATELLGGTADYLVISHADFIDAIQPLVKARQAQGLRPRVVDVEDVYAQYGFGITDPGAIRDYIADAAGSMGVRSVLLVGGDTFDYRDTLGLGSISFIPTLYAATDDIIRFAPVDPLLTDLDGDSVPDLPIGRLPVRTAVEAAELVAKTLAYESRVTGRTAVLAADARETSSDVSFAGQSELFAAALPDGWQLRRAYIDALGVDGARSELLQALNSGVALASFVGHSGPTSWTYRGLFTADDALDLENFGRPAVVVQWGCWNTYHVQPQYETLAHSFLLAANRGAAAVLGSSTLTQSSSAQALSQHLAPLLAQPGMTVGEAITTAKAQLATARPELLDVLLGWTILGDPALVIEVD